MPALTDEAIAVRRIAESLRAARPGNGEGACDIGVFQAIFNFCAANELVDKTCVEAISRTYRIDYIDDRRQAHILFRSSASQCSLHSTLDDNHRNLL